MVEKTQCQGFVFEGRFGSHQCQKKAIMERDGKFYCKVHDPEYKKKKQRQWHEKFDREYTEKQIQYHRQEIIRKVCEPFTTEWLEANANFILASKDMYEVLKKLHLELKMQWGCLDLVPTSHADPQMQWLAKWSDKLQQLLAKVEVK